MKSYYFWRANVLDIKLIAQDPEKIKAAIQGKNEEGDVDGVLALDGKRKEIIAQVEQLKSERNKVSKEVGKAKKEGKDAKGKIQAMKAVSEKIKEMDKQLAVTETALREKMLEIPNIPHASVPKGKSAADNVIVREWGEAHEFTFPAKDHVVLSEALDILDFKRGAKIAGTGFVLYKGLGARLERALINYFLDTNLKNGYTEVFPPFVVNPGCAEGTSQLPKSAEQMYYISEDNYYLIPTAEVPVTNIFRDEIIGYQDMPVYYTAYSACFRREAGSWGKDTRGFLRVHEFNKVEMVKFVTPETSYEELERLVQNAEVLLQALGLTYRVAELCQGDLSFGAAKCYDLEVFAEGEKKWLEVSSCSNYEDFQARRANTRFRDKAGKVRYLHTLNGSGLATSRVIVALIENYQNADGSVTVPEVLRPYMQGIQTIE
jgi:seryl-tRNA synthetase